MGESASTRPTADRLQDHAEIKQPIDEALKGLEGKIKDRDKVIGLIDVRLEKKGELFRDTRELRANLAQDIQEMLKKKVQEGASEELEAQEAADAIERVIQEEIIEAEMKVEDLRTLSIDKLLAMEKERPGILLFAFTTWGDNHKNVSIKNFEAYNTPKSGERIEIDFRGNQEAYWKIGADDILPPQVRQVTVWPKGDASKARVSERRVGLKGGERSGFYDNQEPNPYIPIFDGDVVFVGKMTQAPKKNETSEPLPAVFEGGIDDAFKGMTDQQYSDRDKKLGENSDENHLKNLFGVETLEAVPPKVKTGNLNEILESPGRTEWRQYAKDAATLYGREFGITIDYSTIFAIIKHESGFNPVAQNPTSTARGLGQFLTGTWDQFLNRNRSVAREIYGKIPPDLPFFQKRRQSLRDNAKLSIYATTWLAAYSAQELGLKKVDATTLRKIYQAHHEGVAGKKAMDRYIGLKKEHPEWSQDQLARKARLADHQRRALRDGNLDAHFAMVDGYSRQVELTGKVYQQQTQSND